MPAAPPHRLLPFGLILSVLAADLGGTGNATAAVTIDASAPPPPPRVLAFPAGGVAPSGRVLAVNNRYFTRDGQPWFPVMGEFHYARYPAAEWEREILKMKAGGIDIVATYVFWIFHEETEGRFDWAGQRDLCEFIRLCAKHDLYVWLRLGPWDHGEVRNGGFPDWLVSGATRQNDPAYLDHVRAFFHQIGRQAAGLFWKDGGPIIGVQLENEYHPASGGVAHMQRLRQIAREAGLTAPFCTATGWDKAVIPPADFLPVFGGYTDQFWSERLQELPPSSNFFFTSIRAEDNVGIDLQPKDRPYNDQYAGYPFLTAEMGGGMATAYHRRPVMQADDSTAAALVKLGSGATLLGYYMYHGGTNPEGKTEMQETIGAWNGFNDLEAKSYDFQAPLGEFGQVRASYRTTKALHLFLHDFGNELAPMVTCFPDQVPQSLDDVSTPRVAVRSDGEHGFVFVNNYQRNHALADHPGFQVALKLPSGVLLVPRQAVDLPGGVYTIWPFNLEVGGVMLQYATAQPVCKIADPDTYVFFVWPGVKPEFAFRTAAGDVVEAPRAQASRGDGSVIVSGIEPGTDAAIRVTHPGRKPAQILVLSRAQALNLWKARLDGRERLLLSPAGLFFEANRVHLYSRDPADFRIGVFPAWSGEIEGLHDAGPDGVFRQYVAPGKGTTVAAQVRQIKEAAPSRPARINPNPRRPIAMAPADADFDRAAVWSIHVPASVLSTAGRPVLRISYEGDVARLYTGGRFVDDNFYRGTPFEFGLWRLTPQELEQGIDLKILPLRGDTPLYLPTGAMPAFDQKGEALRLKEVSLAWEYEVVLQPNQ
jgi:beta-galactosidase